MSIEFLSDEWFAKVAELRAEAGDVEVPAALADLAININVDTNAGEKKLALVGGMNEDVDVDGARTTMSVPADLAQKNLIEGYQSADMLGFMSGQIRIEGDMSKLMALQTVQPSAVQTALLNKIQEITA